MERLSWRGLGARPVLFPTVGMAAGVWLGGGSVSSGAAFLGLAVVLAVGALGLGSRVGGHLCALLSFYCGGVALGAWQASPIIPAGLRPGEPVRLEGVLEEVTRTGESLRVVLAASRAPELAAPAVRFKASLSARAGSGLELLPGQRVQLWARLRPERPPDNPGQGDTYQPRRRRLRLFYGGFDPGRVVVLSAAAPWRGWLEETRSALAARVRALAPGPEAAGLYLALSAGLRSELPDEVEEQFGRSGLAHVLSVSGLHVAALALLCLMLLRWVAVRAWPAARRVDSRRLAAPLCIPLLWGYVVFTGNQPPAVRSALMASAVLLGMALWRRADALNGVCLAALALLAADPASVADLSLRLSFTAVLALILLGPALRELLPVGRPDAASPGWLGYALQKAREAALLALCASAAVTLAGLPLVAGSFHRVSLAGLVSNVICMPLCGLLTVLAAGGAAAFVAWPSVATPLLWAGGWASELLLWAARLFSALPGAAIPVRSMGPASTAAFYAGLLAFALGRGRWRWGAALAPLALAQALVLPALLPGPGLSVTFLSVGHGDATVISSRGHHALVDGGGVPRGADTGRRFVLPFLREEGIDRLDLAVLSHPHPDHALGLVSTLAAIPAERLWLAAGSTDGELSRRVVQAAGGAVVEEVEVGRPAFSLGEARLEVLGPPRDRILLEGVNDQSVVLRIRHGQVTMLLAGDLEEAGEEVLAPGPVTVLKAPHHGSRTSSTPAFVAATRARFVVFCVGAASRFRFPSEEVVERYRAAGARCFRTDLNGAVRFTSDGQDVRAEPFRPGEG